MTVEANPSLQRSLLPCHGFALHGLSGPSVSPCSRVKEYGGSLHLYRSSSRGPELAIDHKEYRPSRNRESG